MTSEAVGSKSEAKDAITRAILGLILLLSPVIVFSVINRDILDLDFDLSRLNNGGGANIETERDRLAATCTDVEWRDGKNQNVISPSRTSRTGFPTQEEMSNNQLSRCCSFAEGALRTDYVTEGVREYAIKSCEYGETTITVTAVVHLTDESVITPTDRNLRGRVQIGLCEEIDEKDATRWANEKINELYEEGILSFINPLPEDAVVDYLDLYQESSRTIGCGFIS